ncbi:hypothetical protein TrispH2_003317 [Trichoplax sp. H2]|nr:hypothetical protein TrispH2_003317 [Trichoplax sp. H2]|eukprot:RDD44311.1 hypothetical protein TrispH2_003317 [Trichoplax sp. H2]
MASSKITLKNDNKRGKDVGLDLYSFALRTRLMKTEEAIGVINAREEKILRQVTDSIDKLAKKSLEKYRFDYNAILKISEESRRRNQIFADKLRTYKEEEERVRVLRQAKKMKEKRRFLDDDYLHLQVNKSNNHHNNHITHPYQDNQNIFPRTLKSHSSSFKLVNNNISNGFRNSNGH